MNAPENIRVTESKTSWAPPVPPDDHRENYPDQIHADSRPAEPRRELAWLKEIGWYAKTRKTDTPKTDTPKTDAPKAERGYRAAPMHRRSLLVDEAGRYGRLAPKDVVPPTKVQNRTPIKPPARRGALTPLAIGFLALAIGIISFIAVLDVTGDGRILKSLASLVSSEENAPIEVRQAAVEPQEPTAAESQQTAIVETPLKIVTPVAKPAKPVDVAPAEPEKIIQASEPPPATVAPEPLPAAVAPPAVPKPEETTAIALAVPPAVQQPSAVEGEVLKDCATCPELVTVQSGHFQMGAAADDSAAQPNELPAHEVAISKPFAIGRYEITIDDWGRCVADKACQPLVLNAGWNAPQQPAVQVSWNDITRQYLPWLSKLTGKTYRLPTEAEWEYAARGGSAAGMSDVQAFGKLLTTVAVGSGKPDSLGLYDMQGNVWEWVEDCWNANYKKTPVDGSASTFGDCSLRVARGGSWASSSASLRPGKRGWNKPDTQNNALGFRVARSL